MNSSEAERFEAAYRRIWGALNRPDDAELSHHGREVLRHVPADASVTLTWLAGHLALPKSSASILVKDLARRGLIARERDPDDERRLRIALTEAGRARVAADTVLDPERLALALAGLPAGVRRALLDGMERLASEGERNGR
jgi:DNA-binding MarR family transcriptional regulator